MESQNVFVADSQEKTNIRAWVGMTDRIRKSKASSFLAKKAKLDGTGVKIRRRPALPLKEMSEATTTLAVNAFLLRSSNFHILPEIYTVNTT